jgi:hypothetical protein
MSITKDQLAQLNFGYLNGQDLLQFCPAQLLISQYEKFPDLLQSGCDMAYEEVKGELSVRYDINKELSNANQKLKNQTGKVSVSIAAGTFVSQIYMTWNSPVPVVLDGDASFNAVQLVNGGFFPAIQGQIIDSSPIVKIGTIDGGDQIMSERHTTENGLVFWVNKLFTNATTLFFEITSGNIDIDLQANANVNMPPVSIVALQNKTGDFIYSFPANSYIYQAFATILLGTPSIQIGTTQGGSDILPMTLINPTLLDLIQSYFETDSILYFSVINGSVNLRLDVGYDFVRPTSWSGTARNNFLVKLLAIFAIRNILGSLAGENKMLISHFEWGDLMIVKIKDRQFNINLPQAPSPMRGKNEVVSSSFKTLG